MNRFSTTDKIALAILSAVILIFVFVLKPSTVRVVGGILLTFFLPGLCMTFALYKKTEIAVLERIMLSFGLSILVIPSLLYIASLLGMPLTLKTSLIFILTIIAASLLVAIRRGNIP